MIMLEQMYRKELKFRFGRNSLLDGKLFLTMETVDQLHTSSALSGIS
jgi:hypothetical protein